MALDPLVSSPAPRDVYFQSHELDFFTVSWEPGDITDVTGYLVAYTAGSSGFQRSINDPTTTTITLQDDTLAGNPPTGVLVVPFVAGRVDTDFLVQATDPPLSGLFSNLGNSAIRYEKNELVAEVFNNLLLMVKYYLNKFPVFWGGWRI